MTLTSCWLCNSQPWHCDTRQPEKPCVGPVNTQHHHQTRRSASITFYHFSIEYRNIVARKLSDCYLTSVALALSVLTNLLYMSLCTLRECSYRRFEVSISHVFISLKLILLLQPL